MEIVRRGALLGITNSVGRSSGQLTPRRTTHLDPKGKGDKSMSVKREVAEDVYAAVLQRLSDMAKAKLLEPQYPVVEMHIHRYHVCTPMPSVTMNSGFVRGTP